MISCYVNTNLSKRAASHTYVWCCLIVLLVLMSQFSVPALAEQSADTSETFKPFSFVLTGDPQLGYGNGFEQGSYQRLLIRPKS